MPARGDHDERRREVVRITADLIATGGLPAASNRAIAQAAGCSTTVVSHYFSDKRDLVLATYLEVGERVAQRLERAGQAPADRLSATLSALLPLDEERRRDWRLLFTFLGLAATDPELAAEERVRVDRARARIVVALASVPGRAADDDDEVASALLSYTLGLGLQALFDPGAWPPERQRSVLTGELAERGLAAHM